MNIIVLETTSGMQHSNDEYSAILNMRVVCSLRPWDPEHCLVQFEKDGIIQTQEKSQKPHNGLSFSWASQDKVR